MHLGYMFFTRLHSVLNGVQGIETLPCQLNSLLTASHECRRMTK